ncbi:McrB family protein [Pedobacter frigoris]|uniref:McrB family protein n=1 Tax=Pedobacter frigoris TaxID=2571272 RepID=UPI00292E20A4|nr:AAA family ATPase [Pedobacter frigoris]
MNIFFGKISNEHNPQQLIDGFYEAPKSSTWFNGLALDDYAFIIGGGKIQLWKAKEWQVSENGNDRLYFEVLNEKLPIDISKFVAFKFFYLDIPLIVKSSRSTAVEAKAFFKLKVEDFDLLDYSVWEDEGNFRKIVNCVDEKNIVQKSKDLQFYFDGNIPKMAEIFYADPAIAAQFDGKVIEFVGSGSRNKDKIIREILANQNASKIFSQLRIQQIYDAFMCKYRQKTAERNYWVVNGNDADIISYDLENGIFLMQQQFHDQNNSTVSGLLSKCKRMKEGDGILLYTNNHYYAYGELKKIDFEVEREEQLQDIINNKIKLDNTLVGFEDAICYYEDTRSINGFKGKYGQRLLVEQWNGVQEDGKHIYGVGYETNMVNTTIIKLNDNKFYDKVVRILEGDTFYLIEKQMKELKKLLEYKRQVILQGPPGTGKTYTAKDLAEYVVFDTVTQDKKEQSNILSTSDQIDLIQFHPAYTYEDFIRGIVTEPVGNKINYVSKDKLFLEMVDKASKDPVNPYILIIDEINRANLSSVLGELIYALEYRNDAFKSMYANKNGNYEITIPDNLYIIGTMNTADRSVGHLDYALRRRFAFYDVLPQDFTQDNFQSPEFKKVARLFVKEIKSTAEELEASEHLSLEFQDRPQDIWLGHSYFFKKENTAFSLRLKYEIVPILQEYVKDGILNNTTEVKQIIQDLLKYQDPDA